MIECGNCGREFDQVRKHPVRGGYYWICLVCRKKNNERGGTVTELLAVVFMVSATALYIGGFLLYRTAANEYECKSRKECYDHCLRTEYHNHEWGRLDDIGYAVEIKDNDLRMTQQLQEATK